VHALVGRCLAAILPQSWVITACLFIYKPGESHLIPFQRTNVTIYKNLFYKNVNFYFQFNSYFYREFNIEYYNIILLFFTTTVIKSTVIVSIRYPRYYYYCCTEEKLLNRCYRAQRIIHNHEFYTNSTRCAIPPPWT
jgi:hypothetical protein